MKTSPLKIVGTTFILLFFFQVSQGQIYSDNFDGGTNNLVWSSIQNGTSTTFCGAVSGDALHFTGAGTREAVTKPLIGMVEVEFYLAFGTGSTPCENADPGEDVVLEYSTDNGTTWNQLALYDTEVYTSFTLIKENLPSNVKGLSTQLRWRQITHSNNNFDNWAIEDLHITTINAPIDAGVFAINTLNNICQGNQPINTTIRNYGSTPLDSVRVNWSINDTIQSIHYITTTLDTFGGVGNWETSVSLGNYNFQLGQTYEVKAWTSFPNGVVDTIAFNDSSSIVTSPGLQGTYTIGLSNSDYTTIDSAINHLISFGVCAPVVFNIKNGIYPEQLLVTEVSGADSINTITFQSENGDSSLVRISHAGSSSANYTLLLDGADWVIFKDLTIEAISPSYGKVVVFQGSANHNIFSNNLLKGYNTNSTSSNHSIIYSAGDVDEYNQFLNNRIEYGSQGINIRGINTSNLEKGTIIQNNLFINQYYQGIYLSEQDAPQIKNNIIQPKLGYSSTQGMYLYYCDNELQVNNNQIIGAKSYGLYFGYCNALTNNRGLISNNFVFTDGSSGNRAVYFYRSYYHNFYNNTVNNTSTSSGAYAFFNDRGHFNIKNNIFTANNGIPFYTNSSSYINEIDYNNYYTNGNVLAYWNGNRATLADLQTTSGKDTASLSVNPYFLSDSSYQIGQVSLNNTGISLLEIMTDIEDEARDTLNPDIGADEFTPPPTDAGLIAVLPPNVPFAAGLQPISAILKNFGNDPLTALTIEWMVNDTMQLSVNWTGNLPSGDTIPVLLGNYNFIVGQGYDLKAWTSQPNAVTDVFNPNDTIINLDVYAALSGIYTIGGVLPDFSTFNNAVFALNQGGIIGQTTFNVRDGNYLEQIEITEIAGADSVNTVSFQSENGDSSLVRLYYAGLSSTNYTIFLNGADWVTFKDLTIEAISPSYGKVVVFQSSANHNIFSNNLLKGYNTNSTSSNHSIIYSAGDVDEYNQFLNNRIEDGSQGINIRGLNTSNLEKGTIIQNNLFINQYYQGIYLSEQDAPQIKNNIIQPKLGYSSTQGMYLYYCNNELEVNNNQIIGAKSYGLYFRYCDANSINRGLISNNFVFTDGSSGNRAVYFYRSYYHNFYNNTVNNTSTSSGAYAFFNDRGHFNIKNNIFTANNGIPFYTNSSSYINEIDYNNYYTNGNILAYWNGNKSALADLQVASGKNISSLSVNPYFLSDSSYQIAQLSLNNAGTPLSEVVVDIEGEVRDTLTPDIGANEFVPQGTDAGIISLTPPAQLFAAGSHQVFAQLRNFGADTLSSTTIQWNINNVAQTPVSWAGSLPSGDSINVLLDTVNFTIGQPYDFIAWSENPNGLSDMININDTSSVQDIYAGLGGIYTIGGITPDFNNFTEAVTALNFGGVVSATTFNVRDSIFNEQITINEILGADSLNTITFQSESGDSTLAGLAFNVTNSSFNYIVNINGADWVTFKKLKFEGLNTNYYGYSRLISVQNNPASHLTFENNYFKGYQGVGYIYYDRSSIYFNGTLAEYLVIQNNYFEGNYEGLSLSANYNSNNRTKGLIIQNNIFDKQHTRGIYARYFNNGIIRNNTIIGGSNSGYDGLVLSDCSNGFEITNNRFQNILNIGLHLASVYGSASEDVLVANNFIHTEGTNTSYGIYSDNGSYQKIYHNNINIQNTSTNSSAFYNRYNNNKLIKNNNFINNGGGYSTYYQNTPTESNYNNLFTTGTNIGYLSGNKAELTDWQTTNLDTNSISIDPFYTDSVDLYVTNVLLDKAGTGVPEVTTDIDGNGRDAVRPDIGADEFSTANNDAGITALYAPNKPFEATSHPIYAKLLNNGIDTLRDVTINWTVNNIPQTPFTWSDSLVTGAFQDSLNIGSFIFEEDTLYNIVAWASQPNFTTDADSLNDTTSVGGIYAALGGLYTIGGTTPDYPTIQTAVTALQNGGVVDSVTFNIRAGTYTEQVSVPEIVGVDSVNHITFQSESGDSSDVIWTYASTLSNNNYTLQLDGADYFRFKHLTIAASGTTYATAVDIRNSAHHHEFENNEFNGIATTNSSERYSIIYSPSTLDEYITIRGNHFKNGGTGIYFYGNNTSSLERGLNIENNHFDNTGRAGLFIYYQDAPIVHNNNFSTSYVNGSYIAIDTRYCDNDMKITNNTMVDIDRGRGMYIGLSDGTSSKKVLIANNFVHIKGSSTARGIELAQSSYIDVFHNNVHITATSNGQTALFTYYNNGNIRLRNNIFANTGSGYAIYSYTTNVTDITSSNYNDLYTTGSNLTRWNNTNQSDLATWQTASGFGTNSISIDPLFTSTTDLHVEEVDLNNAGTPLASVTTDIDREVRSATTPDIGADEFAPIALNDVGIVAITAPNAQTPFAAGNQDVYAVIKNHGSDTIASASVHWSVNNNLQPVQSWSGNLLPGERDTLNLGTFNFSIGLAHDILAYTQNPNSAVDSTAYNDSTLITDLYAGLAGVYSIGGVFPDFTTFNDAVDALNNGGVLDSVTFNIRNGTYNEQFTINEIRGVSASKQIIFQSESGDSSLVTLSRDNYWANNYIMKLVGSNYLTFKDLSFETTDNYYTHLITIQNASHISFLNSYFKASNTNHDLIYTTNSSNIVIKNNHFENGYEALDINGNGLQVGTVIQNNIFENQNYRAIDLTYQSAPQILNNSITSNTNSTSYEAMYLQYCDNSLNISKNKIFGIIGGGIYLRYCDGTTANKSLISNNFIQIEGTNGETGLTLYSGSYLNIYNNSISITNTNANSQAIYNYAGSNKNIINNIFANSGSGYAANLYSSSIGILDYNSYYSTGLNIGRWDGNNVLDFNAWKTASGKDINSVNANPLFFDATTNLHIYQAQLDSAGVSLSEVTDDIDNATRNTTHPDIGADEFTATPNDLGIAALSSPITQCDLQNNEIVQIVIQNYGSQSQTGFNVSYSINGGTPIIENVGGLVVAAGDTATYQFSATADLSVQGNHDLIISTNLLSDLNATNNEFQTAVTNFPVPSTILNMLPADGSVNVSPPISFSWLPSIGANYYDFYLWEATDTQPPAPIASNITQISYQYSSNQIQYGQSYKWRVVAKNSYCETESQIQTFTVSNLPDLTVSNVLTPASPSSGQTIQVSWTVNNQGGGNTAGSQSWTDAIYLSPDPIWDNSDTYLKGVSNQTALNSGQAYSNSTDVTLPHGIQNTFYIIVVTDRYNSVLEDDNSNNDGFKSMIVNLTPPPDLQVTSILIPNNAFSNQTININYVVTNEGTGATLENSWYDRIYLSPDSAFNNNAIYMRTNYHNGILEVDSNYTVNTTINLPQGISGSYFVIVETDRNNHVFEHANESNNRRISDTMTVFLTPPPNLQVTNIIIPDTVSNNEQVAIQWTVTNNGASATSSYWHDNIYLSTNINGTNPINLGTQYHNGILNPGASYNGQRTVNIPSNITGDYYVFVETDRYNQVYEHINENDNTLSSTTTMNVINADLIVSTVAVVDTGYSGQTVDVQWTVANQGDGTIFNRTWKDEVFISTHSSYHPDSVLSVGTLSYSATLLSGQSITKQKTITLPNGIFGNYYVYLVTDENDNIFENTNENNNTNSDNLLVLLSPSADLQVNYISSLPDSILAGTYLGVDFTVKNEGQANAGGTTWTDKIYISVDSVWNPNKLTEVGSFQRVLDVNSGNSYTINASVNVPMLSLMVQGLDSNSICYLYVYTDRDDDIYEYATDNLNNITRSEPFHVTCPPPVDLKILSATTPTDTSAAGQQINIQWSVQNIGSTTDYWNYDLWYDGIYLSTDTIWDGSDVFITDWTINGPLDSLATYSDNRTFTVPNGLTGDVYFLMVTDHTNLNNDGDVSNNYKALSTNLGAPIVIHLDSVDYPDLLVNTFVVPTQAVAGQPVKVYYTVTNNGPGATLTGSWTDKVYLSTDFNVDNGDQIIGTKARTDTLQSGESYSDSLDVYLPISSNGNYILIFKTDANNSEYEAEMEANNIFASFITISQPPPSDLVVESITPPPTGFVGEPTTMQWTVKNQGLNPANGVSRDIVYLSIDSLWDVGDIQFGTLQNNANLAPQATDARSLTANLPGLALGDYFVIVRTDALNNIFESNDTNNVTISTSKITITLPELIIDSLTLDTLIDLTDLYYRIEIPDSLIDETLLITIEGDSLNGVNQLFASFDEVPTRSNHDFSQTSPNSDKQELIIPSLQKGTYYVLAYGQTSNGNTQPISLLAEILPFEIRSIQANQGGNTGNVTVKIEGAKFDPNMEIRLEDSTLGMVIAHNIYYVNSTTLFATFDLQGESLGFYDVVLKKLNNEEAILHDGFEIVTGSVGGGGTNNSGGSNNGGGNGVSCTIESIGTENLLNTNIQHPPNTRINRVVPITIQFVNNSNIDAPIPTRFLISLRGAPLSYNTIEFNLDTQELFLEFRELNGPLDVLRPGASGTITVYTRAVAPLRFVLTE